MLYKEVTSFDIVHKILEFSLATRNVLSRNLPSKKLQFSKYISMKNDVKTVKERVSNYVSMLFELQLVKYSHGQKLVVYKFVSNY